VLQHLFSAWAQGPDVLTAKYRIEVIASEGENQPGNTIANAPLVLDVQPGVDGSAPAAPTMVGAANGNSVTLTITPPSDPDLDRVVVCRSVDAAAPAVPQGCDDVAEVMSGPEQVFRFVDVLVTTGFTAFSLDASGNASPGVTVTRAAAQWVSGAAVVNVGYAARATGEEIVWPGASALHVRYAAGSAPPLTATGGVEASQYSGRFGTGALVPVAKGAKVAVSIFAGGDSNLTTYRRTSFVLTGGTGSDSLSLTATSIVDYGRRPAVAVSLVRHTPTGTVVPLTGQRVYVYRRPVGGAWTLVTSAVTSTTGRVSFTVPVPAAATDYQARYMPLHTTTVLAGSGIARTAVRQVITALIPANARHGRAMTVTGSVAPRRVSSVHLQRYRNGHWSTVASARSSTSGAYRIRYVPTSAGRWRYRVLVDATSTLLARASAVRWVTVA